MLGKSDYTTISLVAILSVGLLFQTGIAVPSFLSVTYYGENSPYNFVLPEAYGQVAPFLEERGRHYEIWDNQDGTFQYKTGGSVPLWALNPETGLYQPTYHKTHPDGTEEFRNGYITIKAQGDIVQIFDAITGNEKKADDEDWTLLKDDIPVISTLQSTQVIQNGDSFTYRLVYTSDVADYILDYNIIENEFLDHNISNWEIKQNGNYKWEQKHKGIQFDTVNEQRVNTKIKPDFTLPQKAIDNIPVNTHRNFMITNNGEFVLFEKTGKEIGYENDGITPIIESELISYEIDSINNEITYVYGGWDLTVGEIKSFNQGDTYSSTNPNYDISAWGYSSTGTTCTPMAGYESSTDVRLWMKMPKQSDGNTVCKTSAVEWDIAGINNSATVNSVSVTLRVGQGGQNCSLVDMHQQGGALSSYSASSFDTDLKNGDIYVNNSSLCNSAGWKTWGLGGAGSSDLQSQLSNDRFKVGFIPYNYPNRSTTINYDMNLYSKEDSTANRPQLSVVYTVSCIPNAPTSPSAESSSASQIDLTWVAPTNCTMSTTKVERSPDGSTGWTTIYNSTPKTSHSDTGLSGNEDYFYRISYQSNTGDWGSTTSNVSDYTTPDQIVGLVATTQSNSQIDTSWTASTGSGTVTYDVERRDGTLNAGVCSGFGAWAIVSNDQSGTSFSHTSLSANTCYEFRVNATNSDSTGAYSTTVSSITYSPPDPPTNVSTVINNPDPNPLDVTITWTNPTNFGSGTLTGYEIYRDASLVTTVGAVNSHTDTVPSAGTFTYTVRTITNHGTSVDSNSSQITTPTVPDAPQGLTLSINNPDPSPFTVTVTVSPPLNNGGSAVSGYNIYTSTDDVTYTLQASNVSSPSNITVPNAGLWYFKASAVNNVGEGALSNNAVISTPTVPDAPSLSLAINDPNGLPFDITATFNAPANNGGSAVTNYELYYSSDDITYTKIATGVTTPQTYTVSSAGTHYFKAEANNNVGTGALSIAYSIATPTVPDAPTTSTTINDPDNSPLNVTVSFTPPASNGGSAITGYNIYSSNNDVSYTLEASNVNTPQIVTVPSAGTWYFKTDAINNVGTSTLSSASSITTPSVPDAPTSVTTNIPDVDNAPSSVVVAWSNGLTNGGSAITGYNVYRDGSLLTSLGTGIFTYTDTATKTVSTSYTYEVRITNNVGESVGTQSIITTPSPPNAPVLSVETGTTKATWTVPTSDATITNYKLYRDGSLVTTVSGSTTTYIDRTLITFGNSYNYQVSAVSSIGEGTLSNTVTTTPDTNVDDATAFGTTGTSTIIDWTEPPYFQGQVTSYSVYYSTPYSSNPSTLIGTTSNTYLNLYNQLQYDTNYAFMVLVNSSLGNTSVGNVVNATTTENLGIVTYDPTTGADWFDIDAVNQEDLSTTKYTRVDNGNTVLLEIEYPTNYEDMTCDVSFKFGQQTLQYVEGVDMTATALDAEHQAVVMQFNNQNNEVITVECADQNVPNSASSYTVTTTFGNFPLLTQITDFRTGQYGTNGMFGALDLITLFVVIISMIGFNRINPVAGVILGVSAISGLAYFGVVNLPPAIVGIFALLAFLAWGVTRK